MRMDRVVGLEGSSIWGKDERWDSEGIMGVWSDDWGWGYGGWWVFDWVDRGGGRERVMSV